MVAFLFYLIKINITLRVIQRKGMIGLVLTLIKRT